MPAPGCHRPCGSRRRLYASDPAGNHAVSIHASVPRLPNIRSNPPQLRSRHGHPPYRGGLSGVLPPAAAGHHAGGWDADPDSTYPDLEISRPGTTDRRLFVGCHVSGVVNAEVVLSAAEARYRCSRLASFSCFRTLEPPASKFLAGMKKEKPVHLSFHYSKYAPTKQKHDCRHQDLSRHNSNSTTTSHPHPLHLVSVNVT